MMKKITANKEKKRQAILQSAQEVFLSEGFVSASMDRIASQAGVTKQTVYRYFPNKLDLFQEMLQDLGSQSHGGLFDPLELPDTAEALKAFGLAFVRAHLTDSHLATFRLLVAESGKAPEITARFFSVGPDETGERLKRFFRERLNRDQPDQQVDLWTAMLLAPREKVLLGGKRPTERQLEAHVEATLDFLLARKPEA
ncbi:TetR/AcrR family transcriptional regulator [Rhodovibrionaceae bacterium A322]